MTFNMCNAFSFDILYCFSSVLGLLHAEWAAQQVAGAATSNPLAARREVATKQIRFCDKN
jgi:hypothetical protein